MINNNGPQTLPRGTPDTTLTSLIPQPYPIYSMLLLAPTVTALQTLLEVCRGYAGLHDIVYNTTKTVCMLVRPKQSQGLFSTRVGLGNEELSLVEEFRYLGHIMTADCRADKRILKNNSGGKMQLAICWSGSPRLHLLRQKSNGSVVLLPHLWMCTLASFIPELY